MEEKEKKKFNLVNGFHNFQIVYKKDYSTTLLEN